MHIFLIITQNNIKGKGDESIKKPLTLHKVSSFNYQSSIYF